MRQFKMYRHCLSMVLLLWTSVAGEAQQTLPQLGKQSIDQVVNAMTTREKSLMVTGAKRRNVTPVPLPGRVMKNITAVGGYTYPFVHLGIPSIMVSDGPAGLRIAPRRPGDTAGYYCTAFPVAALMACGWDTVMTQRVGAAMGNEAREYGVDILLGPALNIQRDPLGGRHFEYYSEDPYVSGKMAAAAVKGIQSMGIGACIKHFAANNQETSRRTIDVVVSERALREIYLEGFRMAVKEAAPWSVMSSYNKINGVYTSQSNDLLRTILRKEWGFNGFVMTDWYNGDNVIEQMKAGNDLLMPGLEVWSNTIDSALKNGLDRKTVDDNIKRILRTVLKTGTYRNIPFSNKPALQENARLAREAAVGSMVLLKNENETLPLGKQVKTLALYGNYAYKNIPGGTGSGSVNNRYNVAVSEGLKNAGLHIVSDMEALYLKYLEKGKPRQLAADSLITALMKQDSILGELNVPVAVIQKNVAEADMAVVTFMRVFGEGGDRQKQDFYLTAEEQQLLKNVTAAFHAVHKKVLVVLNVGGVVETDSWKQLPDGILLTWLSGQEGGNAAADIITGKVNPSGKLAASFPVRYEDMPSAANFPGTPSANPEKVLYEEGVYVGYRYFSSFKVKPSYAFGYGLSYTSFGYTGMKLTGNRKGDITVTVKITNTGMRKGREVVQFYVSPPKGKQERPVMELKAFAKTGILLPGQSQSLTVRLNARSLSSFHPATASWLAEPGKYSILAAAASDDIRLTGSYVLPAQVVAEKLEHALTPTQQLKELKLK